MNYLKYDRFETTESTSWNEDCPHYLGLHVYFKSKADRVKFLKKVKEILEVKK